MAKKTTIKTKKPVTKKTLTAATRPETINIEIVNNAAPVKTRRRSSTKATTSRSTPPTPPTPAPTPARPPAQKPQRNSLIVSLFFLIIFATLIFLIFASLLVFISYPWVWLLLLAIILLFLVLAFRRSLGFGLLAFLILAYLFTVYFLPRAPSIYCQELASDYTTSLSQLFAQTTSVTPVPNSTDVTCLTQANLETIITQVFQDNWNLDFAQRQI